MIFNQFASIFSSMCLPFGIHLNGINGLLDIDNAKIDMLDYLHRIIKNLDAMKSQCGYCSVFICCHWFGQDLFLIPI